MSFTADDTTVAAVSGHLQISLEKYLDYMDFTGLKRVWYRLLMALPMGFLFRNFRQNGIVYDYIQKVEQFKFGCVNPTVILDKEKNLVATFTNLTCEGDVPTPVIKISRERLELVTNIPLKNGQRLASVAWYLEHSKRKIAYAWDDFEPNVANCFTDDLAACNQLTQRLKITEWECLEKGLAQIQGKREPGLYYVDLDPDLVNSTYD